MSKINKVKHVKHTNTHNQKKVLAKGRRLLYIEVFRTRDDERNLETWFQQKSRKDFDDISKSLI